MHLHYVYILYIYILCTKIYPVLSPNEAWNSVCRIEEISRDIPAPNKALRPSAVVDYWTHC